MAEAHCWELWSHILASKGGCDSLVTSLSTRKRNGPDSAIFDTLHACYGRPSPKPTLLKLQVDLMLQQEIEHKTMSLSSSLSADICGTPDTPLTSPRRLKRQRYLSLECLWPSKLLIPQRFSEPLNIRLPSWRTKKATRICSHPLVSLFCLAASKTKVEAIHDPRVELQICKDLCGPVLLRSLWKVLSSRVTRANNKTP